MVWNNAGLDVDSIMNMRGLNAFLILINLITFVRFLIDGCLLGDRANRMEEAYHLSCMYILTTWRQIQIYWYWQMFIQKFGKSEIIYPAYHLIIRRYIVSYIWYIITLNIWTFPEYAYFWIDIDIYFFLLLIANITTFSSEQ